MFGMPTAGGASQGCRWLSVCRCAHGLPVATDHCPACACMRTLQADVLPVGRGGKGDQTHSGQDQDASQQSSEENLLEMVRHLHTDLAKEKVRGGY